MTDIPPEPSVIGSTAPLFVITGAGASDPVPTGDIIAKDKFFGVLQQRCGDNHWVKCMGYIA